MTDFAFSKNDTVTLQSAVTKLDLPLDLTIPQTKMWLIVKRRVTDVYADKLFEKTYVAGGASSGMDVDAGYPDDNVMKTIIQDEDTAAITESTRLVWALVLEEPGGKRTTVDAGAFRVSVNAGDPPP